MCNICVFAGTTEGRELVEFLAGQPVQATVCVATEYGETLLPEAENVTVLAGRIPVAGIIRMLQETRFDLVIDATHPYAASITESICTACRETETEYLRLLRQSCDPKEALVCVENAAEAAAFLANTEGSILLTTGSKELAAYSGILDFTQRVYARVLPMDASLEACRTAGLKASHIIAMQGPFSEEMDLATLRFANAAWMVTKDGGEAGGFPAKVSAARKAGAGLVVIGRPPQREGLPFAAVLDVLCKRFGCTVRPQVRIVGIGPGSREAMTREVSEAIETADCLIGAKRMLDAVARPGQPTYDAIAPQDIADFIRAHREYRRFAVVMSGDTGFFSGTKKLLPLLEGCDTAVLPGLSSLSYLCARLQTSYEDVRVVSLHGRQHNILPEVRANGRLFALVGGERGINDLCRTLTAGGLGGVTVSVGQRLGYPDQRIVCGTAAELAEGTYAPLSVALIENPHPDAVVTPGLPDDAFLRSAEGDAGGAYDEKRGAGGVPFQAAADGAERLLGHRRRYRLGVGGNGLTGKAGAGLCRGAAGGRRGAAGAEPGAVFVGEPTGGLRQCAGGLRRFARAYPRIHRRQRREYAGDRGAAAGKKPPCPHRGHGRFTGVRG